jgi:tetratricopeptide (TPR) repeat protein
MTESVTDTGRKAKFVTFYSFKGGSGRSMALANVAWILAASGLRVLTIDWDLEAPGLHQYFRPFLRDPELVGSKGLIDLLWEYSDLVLSPKENWPAGLEDPTLFADPYRYILPLEWPLGENRGCVHFLSAGLQDIGYAGRVRDFDWRAFYERLGGDTLIESLRERLKYDFVLIDSRTGVADTSGICTLQLPDQVVLCFTYNRQNIKGAEAVANSISARSRRRIELTLAATRVEKAGSTLDKARDFAREHLGRFLPTQWSAEERETYWSNCESAYYPEYAFEETISVFREVTSQRAGPFADMKWIATQILGTGAIDPPRISSELRERYLRRIAFQDPRRAALDEFLKKWSPSAGDTLIRELIADALTSGDFEAEYCKALVEAALRIASGFREIGQIQSALDLATRAVELQRHVITYPVETGSAALAQALVVLSVYQSDVNQSAEALTTGHEAVDIWRRLAQGDPARFAAGLAQSFNNLSVQRGKTENTAGALEAIREAVNTYRQLAQHDQRIAPDFAQSLENLSVHLGKADDLAGALAASREAVDAYRRLAQENLARFGPDLARNLDNLSPQLSKAGDGVGAYAANREAAEIYRQLEQDNPARFGPLLAASLDRLRIVPQGVV